LVEPPDEIIDETRAHIRSDRFPHFPKRPRSYNRNTATSAKACNQGIDHLRLDRSRSHFAERPSSIRLVIPVVFIEETEEGVDHIRSSRSSTHLTERPSGFEAYAPFSIAEACD